ncbi:hypothetical protein HOY80DRAFT_993257 [Tuber brumale]|nr:hypothetical protein HOY80DRAFT_993257 [Tuber brumale]
MKSTNLNLFYIALIPLTLFQTSLSHPAGNGRIRISSTSHRYSPTLTMSNVQLRPGPLLEIITPLDNAPDGHLAAAEETSSTRANAPRELALEGVGVEVWEWVVGGNDLRHRGGWWPGLTLLGCRNIRESCDMLHRCCMGYSCVGQKLPFWADPMRHGHCGVVL